MYCPKCSQQQVSDNMRFCSRCGFPLDVVAGLIAHGGVPDALEMKGEQWQQLTLHQKGVRQGKELMLASVIVTFLTALLSIFLKPVLFIPLTGILIFLCGTLRILYASIFERSAKMQTPDRDVSQLRKAARDYLLPARSAPDTDFSERGLNTAEMVAPPSVTEHTTKLLKEE